MEIRQSVPGAGRQTRAPGPTFAGGLPVPHGPDEGLVQKERRGQNGQTEALWQEVMRAYGSCTVCAKHSSHYIHLTNPDLVCTLS